MELFFKKLDEKAIIPQRQTPQSAGVDLCACLENDVVIKPGEIAKIPTKLSVEPSEKDCVLLIFARSGLAVKNGITLANSVGVVDSDYRGEICIGLVNLGNADFTVTHGMRIAQLVVMPCAFADCISVENLSQTQRGEGGFGSTGVM